MNYVLNPDQKKAFAEIIKFQNNPKQRFLSISGEAGTGKTFLINHINNTYCNNYGGSKIRHIVITATTNKAAAVISETFNKLNPNASITSIKTIHSFMNLRVSENYKTGLTKLIPTKNWKVHNNIFLIIDESSMINNALFKYLEKGLDNTCKILFIGDKNQLAPIKEEISPVYSKLNNIDTVYLKQPMRNNSQKVLINLCEQTKKTVETGIFTPIIEVPGIIDKVNGNRLKGILQREFIKESNDRKVLAYTNDKTISYADYIRYIRGYSTDFEENEILINNESCKITTEIELYSNQGIIIKEKLNNYSIMFDGINKKIDMVKLKIADLNNPSIVINVDCFKSGDLRKFVLKHYANKKDWVNYFNTKNRYPDLRSNTTSTVHKAQGATYDFVVVDLNDIGTCTNRNQTARMLYVALSRAKNKVYIRGDLPERFFNT